MRIFIKQLHSRFPIPEIKMSTLIYRCATSMLDVFTITEAAALYRINHKGKSTVIYSLTPPPALFSPPLELFFRFHFWWKIPVQFKIIWWGRREGKDTPIITIPHNSYMPYHMRNAHRKYHGNTPGIVTWENRKTFIVAWIQRWK